MLVVDMVFIFNNVAASSNSLCYSMVANVTEYNAYMHIYMGILACLT